MLLYTFLCYKACLVKKLKKIIKILQQINYTNIPHKGKKKYFKIFLKSNILRS